MTDTPHDRKSGWKVWRFDQMATMSREKIDDPSKADVDYYVGLEHLDSDSLKICRWGSPSDVEAMKLVFRKGDIIFGRRRVYQRKLAVAEFDGICSAHAMVLRAKEDVVDKDFLPFFMQSDVFMERAKEISVGSLSPTINWKTLAKEEFTLPPIKEQKRISIALWAIEIALRSLLFIECFTIQIEHSMLRQWFGVPRFDTVYRVPEWPIVQLEKVAIIQTGLAKGGKIDPENAIEIPYLRVANVQDGFLDINEIKRISVEKNRIERYSLMIGDVLLTEGGDFDKLGRGTVWQGEIDPCLHQNHIFAVRVDRSRLRPEFLAAQARSTYGKMFFLRCSKRTSNLASINKRQLSGFPVLLPELQIQDQLLNQLRKIDEMLQIVKERRNKIKEIKNTLLNTVLNNNLLALLNKRD